MFSLQADSIAMLGGVLATKGSLGDEAATRIQARFRGERSRRSFSQQLKQRRAKTMPLKAEQNRFNKSEAQSSEAQSCEVFKSESDGTGGVWRVHNTLSGGSTGSWPRKFYSTFSNAEQYLELRRHLERKPTRFSPRVQSMRIELYLLFEEPRSSTLAQVQSVFILVFILLSILIFVLETVPELKPHVSDATWLGLEVCCIVVFTAEFLARLCVCTVPGASVCKFLRSPMNIIDLCAILPFYVSVSLHGIKLVQVLGLMRVLRLVRLFRIFKLGRYSAGLQLIMVALRNSTQGAAVLGVFLGIGVVFFSSLIFYVEKMDCPDRAALAMEPAADGSGRTALEHYLEECHSRSRGSRYALCCNEHDAPLDFPTIIQSFWWSIVTMTTVGFGDRVPRTTLGKCVGSLTMLCGILLIALPTAVIGRKFREAYVERMEGQGQKVQDARLQAPGPSLHEMGRLVQMMRLPDHPEVGRLARELAEEFGQLAQVQEEIESIRNRELEKHGDVLRIFERLLERFLLLTKREQHQQSQSKHSAATGSNRERAGVWASPRSGSGHASAVPVSGSSSRDHTTPSSTSAAAAAQKRLQKSPSAPAAACHSAADGDGCAKTSNVSWRRVQSVPTTS